MEVAEVTLTPVLSRDPFVDMGLVAAPDGAMPLCPIQGL